MKKRKDKKNGHAEKPKIIEFRKLESSLAQSTPLSCALKPNDFPPCPSGRQNQYP